MELVVGVEIIEYWELWTEEEWEMSGLDGSNLDVNKELVMSDYSSNTSFAYHLNSPSCDSSMSLFTWSGPSTITIDWARFAYGIGSYIKLLALYSSIASSWRPARLLPTWAAFYASCSFYYTRFAASYTSYSLCWRIYWCSSQD